MVHPLDPIAALPQVLSEAIEFHAIQGLHSVAGTQKRQSWRMLKRPCEN